MYKSERFLEIGHGSRPAIINGGTLFEQKNIQYTGVEFTHDYFTERAVEAIKGNTSLDADFVQASIENLPFADNTLDYVFMRSMFGQANDYDHMHMIGMLREKAIPECFRILKPGGKIIILEENTPWDSDILKADLKYWGFRISNFAVMEDDYETLDEKSKWKKIRKPYFDRDTTQPYGSMIFDNPYACVAVKPKG